MEYKELNRKLYHLSYNNVESFILKPYAYDDYSSDGKHVSTKRISVSTDYERAYLGFVNLSKIEKLRLEGVKHLILYVYEPIIDDTDEVRDNEYVSQYIWDADMTKEVWLLGRDYVFKRTGCIRIPTTTDKSYILHFMFYDDKSMMEKRIHKKDIEFTTKILEPVTKDINYVTRNIKKNVMLPKTSNSYYYNPSMNNKFLTYSRGNNEKILDIIVTMDDLERSIINIVGLDFLTMYRNSEEYLIHVYKVILNKPKVMGEYSDINIGKYKIDAGKVEVVDVDKYIIKDTYLNKSGELCCKLHKIITKPAYANRNET